MPSGTQWGPAKGNEELTLMAMQQGLMEHRRTAAFIFTFVTFCVFVPPCVVSIQLGSDPDVGFWLGRFAIGTICVPFIVLIAHVLHLSMLRKPQMCKKIMFATALIPSIWFCCVGGIYMSSADYHASRFRTGGCGLVEAGQLQDAYEKAQALRNTCVARLTKSNGNVPLPYNPPVTMCEEYAEALEKDSTMSGGLSWRWSYLAHTEVNHICSGFCTPGPALWTASVRNGLPCARHVANKLYIVEEQAVMVLVYGVVMVVATFLCYFVLMAPIWKALGYELPPGSMTSS